MVIGVPSYRNQNYWYCALINGEKKEEKQGILYEYQVQLLFC